MIFEYKINPVPKPRMTKRDRWGTNKRECVERYHKFRDFVKAASMELPESGYHLTFVIPMPKTWSNKKREKMAGQPHRQRPDKDNLEKAVLDAIFIDDSHIWDGRVTKIWGYEGKIIIEY